MEDTPSFYPVHNFGLYLNSNDNTLYGHDGDDILDGGAGNDIMTGLGIMTGVLTTGAFQSGTVDFATESDDRIIYNTSTGALFYDKDGTGSTEALQIAVIRDTSHPVLTNADCMVI